MQLAARIVLFLLAGPLLTGCAVSRPNPTIIETATINHLTEVQIHDAFSMAIAERRLGGFIRTHRNGPWSDLLDELVYEHLRTHSDPAFELDYICYYPNSQHAAEIKSRLIASLAPRDVLAAAYICYSRTRRTDLFPDAEGPLDPIELMPASLRTLCEELVSGDSLAAAKAALRLRSIDLERNELECIDLLVPLLTDSTPLVKLRADQSNAARIGSLMRHRSLAPNTSPREEAIATISTFAESNVNIKLHLVEGARSKFPDVESAFEQILGRYAHSRIATAKSSVVWFHRLVAIRELIDVDIEAVSDAMLALLGDSDQRIRGAAASVLAAHDLTDRLSFADKHPQIRRLALESRRPTPQTLSHFVNALHDKHAEVRLAAARSLERFGWSPNDHERSLGFAFANLDFETVLASGVAREELLGRIHRDRDPSFRRYGHLLLPVQDGTIAEEALARFVGGDVASMAFAEVLRRLRERVQSAHYSRNAEDPSNALWAIHLLKEELWNLDWGRYTVDILSLNAGAESDRIVVVGVLADDTPVERFDAWVVRGDMAEDRNDLDALIASALLSKAGSGGGREHLLVLHMWEPNRTRFNTAFLWTTTLRNYARAQSLHDYDSREVLVLGGGSEVGRLLSDSEHRFNPTDDVLLSAGVHPDRAELVRATIAGTMVAIDDEETGIRIRIVSERAEEQQESGLRLCFISENSRVLLGDIIGLARDTCDRPRPVPELSDP